VFAKLDGATRPYRRERGLLGWPLSGQTRNPARPAGRERGFGEMRDSARLAASTQRLLDTRGRL